MVKSKSKSSKNEDIHKMGGTTTGGMVNESRGTERIKKQNQSAKHNGERRQSERTA